jgi:hypothetical protein
VKTLLIFFIISFAFIHYHPARANHPPSDLNSLVSSFENGSSEQLAKFFSKGVELNINGNKGEYSARQAEIVIKNFFKKFPADEFVLTHEENSNKGFVHLIANYFSSQGKFKIIIRGKSENEQFYVFSLDILRN